MVRKAAIEGREEVRIRYAPFSLTSTVRFCGWIWG
jgi:hypothetical protein